MAKGCTFIPSLSGLVAVGWTVAPAGGGGIAIDQLARAGKKNDRSI
jgi:hypothetical protein